MVSLIKHIFFILLHYKYYNRKNYEFVKILKLYFTNKFINVKINKFLIYVVLKKILYK